MFTVYTVLALAGGTLLLCQVVATLLGLGGDFEADFDADTPDFDTPDLDVPDADAGDQGGDHSGHGSFVGALSLRALTAAATFAGLFGLIGSELRWAGWLTALAALLGGAAGLVAVSWVMRQLHRLGADGTVTTEGVAGCYGTVYVRVPADRSGVGKVLLEYAGRTVEMAAVTDGPELPSGTKIVVRDLAGPNTADVAAI
ncbi:hypothetical protein [Alienimonas californiensis]|uniref:NfeD-like C-terminal domain-containing protein n=1 Tax=Alienimonas californiensis TaxID=2527989 RepID=A0A517PCY0_9PLAN|nr:hypothetical protein [Alienimonas californiensis]QDT17238.1 hypothetical protein CA12_33510 [Alienimonas californiensis]